MPRLEACSSNHPVLAIPGNRSGTILADPRPASRKKPFPAAPPPTRSCSQATARTESSMEYRSKAPHTLPLPIQEVTAALFGPECLAEDGEEGADDDSHGHDTVSGIADRGEQSEGTEERKMSQSNQRPMRASSSSSESRPSYFKEEWGLPCLSIPFGQSIDDLFVDESDRQERDTLAREEKLQRKLTPLLRRWKTRDTGPRDQTGKEDEQVKQGAKERIGAKQRISGWFRGLKSKLTARPRNDCKDVGVRRLKYADSGLELEGAWWQRAAKE